MSADEELGYVYLPVSTPTNDYYGGHRPGDGLYGESLVCLDVTTGKKVWHYQLVHHGLWDYDPPAAPNLIDITVGGQADQGGRAGDKAGLCLCVRSRHRQAGVADRGAAGAGLERARRAARRRRSRFPTKPAPFDIQGARDEDLIDLTPEIHKEAIDIARAYDRGGLYTPPIAARHHRGARQCRRRELVGCGDRSGNCHALCRDAAPAHASIQFASREPWQGTYDFIGIPQYLPGPRGLPLLKPPFGSIVAIDMNSGEHRWRIPVGTQRGDAFDQQARHPENLGLPSRSWALVTRTVMVVVQMGYYGPPRFVPGFNLPIRDLHNRDPHLRVYDKTSGEMLAEMELPPMRRARR